MYEPFNHQKIQATMFECFNLRLLCSQIFRLGASVAFVFFVTLAAFPALTSRIRSVHDADKTAWTSEFEVLDDKIDLFALNYCY